MKTLFRLAAFVAGTLSLALMLVVSLAPLAGLALIGLVVLAAAPAFAADAANTVVIPYGEYVTEVAHIASAVLVPLILWLLAGLGGPVGLFLRTFLGERLVRNAVDYAINATEGAMKGKTLSVTVGNQVLAEALRYATTQGAGWLVKSLGGPDGIRAKIFRALNLDEAASARAMAVTPPK